MNCQPFITPRLSLTAGNVIINNKAFISPTGVHFRAGTEFIVARVGNVNTLCYAKVCGSLIWLADGRTFATR